MAKTSVELFINAISVFNQDRYQSDAALAARFANLTPADVTVSNVSIDGDTDVVSAEINSATRSFKGTAQTFKRASLQNAKILPFTQKTLDGVTDQASFLEAIKHIDVAGIYQVAVPELSNANALLVVHPAIDAGTAPEDVEAATITAVRAVLDAALLYTFEATATSTVVGSTIAFADNYMKEAVYHAPVGATLLTIPATDYGQLDDATYLPTL